MLRRARLLTAALSGAALLGLGVMALPAAGAGHVTPTVCRNPGSNAPGCRPTPTPSPTTTTTAPPTTSPAPTTTPPPTGTYPVPGTIPADCSVDTSAALLTWLAGVPDGSTAQLAGGCYRVESTLELRGRTLTVDGAGATLRSFDPPDDQRAIWRWWDSTVALRNMTLAGSYASGGTFTSGLQHAHGVDLRGTAADLAGLTVEDVAGDCVYFGLGATRSSGSLSDSTCLRTSRNGVSVTAGDHITVQRSTLDAVGYIAVDVEPNTAAGFGSDDVTVTGNLIGSYYLRAYSVIANAPVSRQTFSNNQVTAAGSEWAVVGYPSTALRPQGVTISGNVSTVTQSAPAVQVADTDGLTVTGNTVPLLGGTFAAVVDSCTVDVSGNSYPGGDTEASVTGTCPSPTPSPTASPTTTPAPIAGYPSVADTGSGVDTCPATKTVVGDWSSAGAGTVIENLDIRGELNITDPNVTVRCTRVARDNGNSFPWVIATRNDTGTTTLDRVTVTNGGGVAMGGVRQIGAGKIVASRVQIVGTQDGCSPCGFMDMTDSYIQLAPTYCDPAGGTDPCAHNDGVQTSGGTTNLVHNTIINHNGETSDVAFFTELGPMVNSTVRDNFFSMGRQLAAYTGCSTDGHPPSNVLWDSNVFVRNDLGWTDPFYSRCAGVTLTGNTWDDGTPIL